MLNIRLICVGKLKEKFYLEACKEYEKRLSTMCKMEILQLDEEPDRPGALAKEAEKIRAAIPAGSYVIAMCIEGKELSSPALAEKMEQFALGGASQLTFLIGGSVGLDDALKQKADLRLSMSPMTFPHHLARIMLLEQIYRAYQILSGSKYHK